MSDTVWDPVRGVDQLDWRYKKSGVSLKSMLPYFYNQMRDYGDASVAGRIISGVVQCVALGEEKFQQAFGGWMPESNEFGLCPLRPAHVDKVNGRWRWTSGATSSINWSAEDGFIASFSLASDELILVYGYFNLEPVPNTLELFIQPGSEKLPIWSIEQMRVMEESYFILPKPIIIEPRSQFAVLASVKSGATATAEEAGLMGYMFAPKSKLITKKRVVS